MMLLFIKNNEPFKVELVEAIPADETVTFYQQGNFIDLCRGRMHRRLARSDMRSN